MRHGRDIWKWRCRRCIAKARREQREEVIRKIKESTPCTDCGEQYPHWVMEFDHLGNKLAGINELRKSSSMSRLLAEMAKCEIVCSNCHADRTYRRQHGLPLRPRFGEKSIG